jgi:hypothetical protein
MLEQIKNLKMKDVRKFLVALATLAAQMLALGMVPEAAQGYVVAVLSALNAIGVFAIRNGDKVVEPGHLDDFQV